MENIKSLKTLEEQVTIEIRKLQEQVSPNFCYLARLKHIKTRAVPKKETGIMRCHGANQDHVVMFEYYFPREKLCCNDTLHRPRLSRTAQRQADCASHDSQHVFGTFSCAELRIPVFSFGIRVKRVVLRKISHPLSAA